jgi:hypothetical protein
MKLEQLCEISVITYQILQTSMHNFLTVRFFRSPAPKDMHKFYFGSHLTISDDSHTCEIHNFPAT